MSVHPVILLRSLKLSYGWTIVSLLSASIGFLTLKPPAAMADSLPQMMELPPFSNSVQPTHSFERPQSSVPSTDEETEATPPMLELAIDEVAQSPPAEKAVTLIDEEDHSIALPSSWPELQKKLDGLGKNQSVKEKLLAQWIAQHPEEPSTEEAQFYLARVVSWQGRFLESIRLYDSLIQRSPQNSDYKLGKAQVLVWAKKPEEALPLLDETLRLSPNYEEAYRVKLQALAQLKRNEEFELVKAEAIQKFPDSEWSLAGAQERQPLQIETGYGYQHLNNNFDNWNNQYLILSQPFGKRAGVYGQLERTSRFDQSDLAMMGGAYFPIPRTKWNLGVEGGGSPTGRIVPRWHVSGEVQRLLPFGFVAKARYTHTEYRDAITEMGIYTLENYWKNFRTAYSLYQSYLHQAGNAFSHVGELQYYYGERSYVGLTGSLGRELTNTGGFLGVVATDVHALNLSGLQMLHPRFGATYLLFVQRQGDLYTRKGFQVGIRAFL